MRGEAMSAPKRLRRLIADGAVMMPGVPNAAMARQVEQAGFSALYISGAGLSNATGGVPDIGLLTLPEVAQLAGVELRSPLRPDASGSMELITSIMRCSGRTNFPFRTIN